MPLALINFRKFITGNEKWILCDNIERRKWIDSSQHQPLNLIFTQKKFCQEKGH